MEQIWPIKCTEQNDSFFNKHTCDTGHLPVKNQVRSTSLTLNTNQLKLDQKPYFKAKNIETTKRKTLHVIAIGKKVQGRTPTHTGKQPKK